MPEGKKTACLLTFLAGFFTVIGQIFLDAYNSYLQFIGQLFIAFAIVFGWYVLIFFHRLRFFIATFGILAFIAWFVIRVFEAINHLSLTKESAFIIAVTVFAWLAMSCYALSLLKDSQSDNEEEDNDDWEHYFSKYGPSLSTKILLVFWIIFILLLAAYHKLGIKQDERSTTSGAYHYTHLYKYPLR